MKKPALFTFLVLYLFIFQSQAMHSQGKTYYVNNMAGNDANDGMSPAKAWKSLGKASKTNYAAGDKLLLFAGCTFNGTLHLTCMGSEKDPVTVSSYDKDKTGKKPVIDSKGYLAAINIKNSGNVVVSNIEIVSDGSEPIEPEARIKRFGVWIEADKPGVFSNIKLSNLFIHNIFSTESTKDEGQNPTSNHGMGIGTQMADKDALLKNITIEGCTIETTGHTGIKPMGNPSTMLDGLKILNNKLIHIGGPGMVPSRCKNVIVSGNTVDCSGYNGDPRMHARGSGIWPWTCNNVLIEKNRFMHARGRNDSHGVHIDFNCNDVIVQNNLFIDNEGGFVEILGNNRNCTYRYNISINDGTRIRGVNGANAPGRALWIFGFAGSNNPRKGPFNSYIYNNTIFVKESIITGFTFDTTASGILVANNIFYLMGGTKNFNVGKSPKENLIPGVVFKNNLYSRVNLLPEDLKIKDNSPVVGDPSFSKPGGVDPADYLPKNVALIKDKGIKIEKLPGDEVGIKGGLDVKTDFFGNPVKGMPDIGAIEIK